MTYLYIFTVQPGKPWTLEISQECLLCYDQSQQRSGHANKPQDHKLVNILACGSVFSHLDQVVRRPVSANPGLNFNPGLFFFSSKAFSRKIFPILFRLFNHKIVDKKNQLNLLFKLSYLNSNFVPTLGYVNQAALNNPALVAFFL